MKLRIERQSPETRKSMLDSIKISPLHLERWLNGDSLPTEDLDKIDAWLTGDFVIMDGVEGRTLRRRPKPGEKPLGIRADKMQVEQRDYGEVGTHSGPAPSLKSTSKKVELPTPPVAKPRSLSLWPIKV